VNQIKVYDLPFFKINVFFSSSDLKDGNNEAKESNGTAEDLDDQNLDEQARVGRVSQRCTRS
jgi:hypothetical protein